MSLGYDKPLYILAFDHRGSFQKKFFGVSGEPDEEETARISDAKRVIYDGARRALDRDRTRREVRGLPVGDAGREERTGGIRLPVRR